MKTQLLNQRTVHSSKGNRLRTPISKHDIKSIHIHPMLKHGATPSIRETFFFKFGVGINKKYASLGTEHNCRMLAGHPPQFCT